MGCDHGHGVERVQLAIAPPDFVFSLLFIGDVEQETLIAINKAGRIARSETAFESGNLRAVFVADVYLKVAHKIVRLYLFPEHGTLLR